MQKVVSLDTTEVNNISIGISRRTHWVCVQHHRETKNFTLRFAFEEHWLKASNDGRKTWQMSTEMWKVWRAHSPHLVEPYPIPGRGLQVHVDSVGEDPILRVHPVSDCFKHYWQAWHGRWQLKMKNNRKILEGASLFDAQGTVLKSSSA